MIIQEFKDARAIIVDVRRNGGGDDRVGKLIADRFADRKRLYMTTQIRNGKEHNDVTPKNTGTLSQMAPDNLRNRLCC